MWEENKMDDLKKTIIKKVENSSAKHPVELIQELLVILYSQGYSDGCAYSAQRFSEENN